MKKLISMFLVLITASLMFGCTTTAEDTEYKKGEYNLAYLTIPFLNETTRISEEDQMSRNPDYQGNINTLKTYSSGYNYEALTHAYFCYITDWEYSKNDTIILYLKDGRTLQTSASNVLLVYDPEFD